MHIFPLYYVYNACSYTTIPTPQCTIYPHSFINDTTRLHPSPGAPVLQILLSIIEALADLSCVYTHVTHTGVRLFKQQQH